MVKVAMVVMQRKVMMMKVMMEMMISKQQRNRCFPFL